MKKNTILLLIFLFLFIFYYCEGSASQSLKNNVFDDIHLTELEKPNISNVKSIGEGHSEEAKSYYKEIVTKNEYNENYTPQKWYKDMKIFVKGNKLGYLMDELNKVVSELNDLITGIDIKIVNTESESNFIVYFGGQKEYNQLCPYSIKFTEHNYGLFVINSRGNEITDGSMYVDIDRTTKINAEKHLLREELTQSLGLTNDSYKYPESIFYGEWTETIKYTELDKEIIKMLYN
jgi:hypothetical protein